MPDPLATTRSGRELIRRLRAVDAETLLSFFTERQYVKPRATLRELLAEADARLGVCPVVAERACDWLDMEMGVTVGRLRRTELTQLARCLHRFLRHSKGGQCGRGRATGRRVAEPSGETAAR